MISSEEWNAGAAWGCCEASELDGEGVCPAFEGEETAFFAERISLSALFAALVSLFCDLAASRASRALASSKRSRWISNFCWRSSWSCCH